MTTLKFSVSTLKFRVMTVKIQGDDRKNLRVRIQGDDLKTNKIGNLRFVIFRRLFCELILGLLLCGGGRNVAG